MSSISDNNDYPSFCLQAALDDDTFCTFKKNVVYNNILEHVTYAEGIEYINHFKDNPVIMSALDLFRSNDKLGAPRTYNFPLVGNFSPTTLRYIKVLHDLMMQLDLNGKHVVEIGAGYGGQYTVMRQVFKPLSYTFVDLSPVVKLIEKYVKRLSLDDIPLNFVAHTDVPKQISCDLAISNYAFSECNIHTQDIYISSILQHAKSCYMIHNNFNGYPYSDFINKISNSSVRVTDESPRTHPNNVLITW